MIDELCKLNEIGGWVTEDEVRHHLGDSGVLELLEAESEGLVETKTSFALSEQGTTLLAGQLRRAA